jgi:hypothetical protein
LMYLCSMCMCWTWKCWKCWKSLCYCRMCW